MRQSHQHSVTHLFEGQPSSVVAVEEGEEGVSDSGVRQVEHRGEGGWGDVATGGMEREGGDGRRESRRVGRGKVRGEVERASGVTRQKREH